jgi:hypothetical protein
LLTASLHRELRSLSTHMHSADCAVTQKVRATITPLHREHRATLFTGRALNMSLNRELKSIANRMQSADRVTCRTLIAPLHRDLKSISVLTWLTTERLTGLLGEPGGAQRPSSVAPRCELAQSVVGSAHVNPVSPTTRSPGSVQGEK